MLALIHPTRSVITFTDKANQFAQPLSIPQFQAPAWPSGEDDWERRSRLQRWYQTPRSLVY